MFSLSGDVCVVFLPPAPRRQPGFPRRCLQICRLSPDRCWSAVKPRRRGRPVTPTKRRGTDRGTPPLEQDGNCSNGRQQDVRVIHPSVPQTSFQAQDSNNDTNMQEVPIFWFINRTSYSICHAHLGSFTEKCTSCTSCSVMALLATCHCPL